MSRGAQRWQDVAASQATEWIFESQVQIQFAFERINI